LPGRIHRDPPSAATADEPCRALERVRPGQSGGRRCRTFVCRFPQLERGDAKTDARCDVASGWVGERRLVNALRLARARRPSGAGAALLSRGAERRAADPSPQRRSTSLGRQHGGGRPAVEALRFAPLVATRRPALSVMPKSPCCRDWRRVCTQRLRTLRRQSASESPRSEPQLVSRECSWSCALAERAPQGRRTRMDCAPWLRKCEIDTFAGLAHARSSVMRSTSATRG
jgi:hypothetical protein